MQIAEQGKVHVGTDPRFAQISEVRLSGPYFADRYRFGWNHCTLYA